MFCYYKQCFNKLLSIPHFNLAQEKFLGVELLGQIGLCIYNSDGSCQIILHKDCPNLRSHQQWMSTCLLIQANNFLNLFLSIGWWVFFKKIASAIVLIFISLINQVSTLPSHDVGPFKYHFCKISIYILCSIFLVNCWSFTYWFVEIFHTLRKFAHYLW